ncbi:MAG: septum site-determining protein MinC [Prochlorococcus sp.]
MEDATADQSRAQAKVLRLPRFKEAHWLDALPKLLNELKPGKIELDCQDWTLGHQDLSKLSHQLGKAGLTVIRIQSCVPETLVSAAALGHLTELTPISSRHTDCLAATVPTTADHESKLLFHQGTLHSGDHLDADGDVMLFGDVNPGARITAGGDVMVWGRLRGIAHAGKQGNTECRITALQLRPVQLRIASSVARGPDDQPPPGLAEQARLVEGAIVIEPAGTPSAND